MAVIQTAFTTFLAASLSPGQKVPPLKTITTSAAVTLGATTIPIAASTVYLEAGRKIRFSGTAVDVIVGATVLVGGTSITVANPTGAPAIASAATATTYQYFEFIGGEGVDVNAEIGQISIRNFKSGAWTENAKTSVGVTVSIEGQFDSNDRAIMNVIRPSVYTLGEGTISGDVYLYILRPNGDIYEGAFQATAYGEPGALDNVYRVSATFSSQGAVKIPASLSLTA